MSIVTNPIIRGFNPDPSIIRVGEDYYIATSTFEWFPGVQIHHSKDLVNWELVARPLNRISQLDMIGVPDSCGVWAPCLTYHDGTFYLVFTNTKSFQGTWKDTPNYLVTTDNILGDWSNPSYLSSAGFDGSLFHDDDGKKWYTSMIIDHRKGKFFGGIVIQEFDPAEKKLTGDMHHIFEGSELGITEGPHIYKKDGYYYLLTAEGGTEYGHAVTIARSKDILGPYEIHPNNPLLTSANHPDHELQKAGHADLVQTPEGDWRIVFLTGRPLQRLGRCTLGRETSIEKVIWKENEWPELDSPVPHPRVKVKLPEASSIQHFESESIDQFDKEEININWQSLRQPFSEEWIKIDSNEEQLTLFGGDSLSSLFEQSLIGRRIQHFDVEVTTKMDFEPESYQQMAGLAFYYNTSHYHYLNVSFNPDSNQKELSIVTCDNNQYTEPLEEAVTLEKDQSVYIKGIFNRKSIRFYYSTDGIDWVQVGPDLDGSILSDDYVIHPEAGYSPAFTGAFVALCCQDLSGRKAPANYHFFYYTENNNN